MTGPDFIVIGAMKCGTTTLADQLSAQDCVFMTTPKEPNFFSDDEVFAQGPDWYLSLFADAAGNPWKGEASTHYTKLPKYPETSARMHRLYPDLKLIYMIRNPIERAVSHYIHEWSERRVNSKIETAFAETTEFVDFGRYAYQLSPYLKLYGPESIHLTSLEQIGRAPEDEFRKIADFLDLPSTARWNSELGPSNVSSKRLRTFPLRKLLLANPVMRPLRRALVPKSVRSWVWNQFTIKKRPELPDHLRMSLEKVFLQDRDDLSTVFPDHPALDLCYPFAPK